MAKNLKDRQAQYDKCLAQQQQYKYQQICPSRCYAHTLLHRLIKKLGEHHILALLVEPKILEEPDPRIQKIIQAQKNYKINTPQPPKRPLNDQNGHQNSATKKPRNSIQRVMPRNLIYNNMPRNSVNVIQQFPRGNYNSLNGFASSRPTPNIVPASPSLQSLSRSTSFSSTSSLPSLRSIAPCPPSAIQCTPPVNKPAYRHSIDGPPNRHPSNLPVPSLQTVKKFSTPCLVPQVAHENGSKVENCYLKVQYNGMCSYFARADSQISLPHIPTRKYEISQCETGITKIELNTEKTGNEQKLHIRIYRCGPKKFQYFGMAFRDNNELKWRCTSENPLPDDRMVSVVIPLSNVSTRLAVFSIWFGMFSNPDVTRNSNPEVMCAPIMVDLFCENGTNFVAQFEPDIVEIDDD